MVVHVLRFEDAAAAHVSPDATDAYASEVAVVASRHGVRVAGWFAVEGTIIGDGRAWHQVRFHAFPSKRAFTAVESDPARLQAQTDYRDKAIADTDTIVVRPFIDLIAQ